MLWQSWTPGQKLQAVCCRQLSHLRGIVCVVLQQTGKVLQVLPLSRYISRVAVLLLKAVLVARAQQNVLLLLRHLSPNNGQNEQAQGQDV